MSGLSDYLKAFRSLNVNRVGGRASPHKPCMLLAVLGLAESGHLERNEIRFEQPLLERFSRFFSVVRTDTDRNNAFLPFFYLRSDGFWHLRALPDKEAVVEAMRNIGSTAEIRNNIAYAYLDDALHRLVLDPLSRQALREELVVAWFGSRRMELEKVLQEERQSDLYESALRDSAAGKPLKVMEEPAAPARSAAFRRIVSEIYDYRCAASGWRIILPDNEPAMVEAAHIIPFAESHDDDPRNGIALTPSFHWAMDRKLIAPGPDYKWHVSQTLDKRIPDNKPLLELDGQSLILPKDKRMWPCQDALEWRLRTLAHPFNADRGR